MLYFVNDYCEGAHPAILQKLLETNMEKLSGYGTDKYCDSAKEKDPESLQLSGCRGVFPGGRNPDQCNDHRICPEPL